jgi:nitrite reductase/ring-hydroxylating ferredoxin subunit/uncharacterized membrane protein
VNPEISSTGRLVDAAARSTALDGLADAIQPPLQAWLEGEGPVRRAIKDALHGTSIGHALHPMLTDVPIGAWTVTAASDLLALCGARTGREAGDFALRIGVAGAIAAAAAGWADWSDTKDEPRRLGLLHALLNGGALACYVGSLAARRANARGLGVALSLTGYGAVVTAAYLGGELSLGMQLGVKHTAVPVEPGDAFVRVIDEADVSAGGMCAANADGVPLLVARVDGEIRAVGGVCTHRGAPLAEGERDGRCVRCPWHGSRFDLADGTVVEGPATFPLPVFDVRLADGGVSVRPRRTATG